MDSAIDNSDNIYVVYLKDNGNAVPQIHFRTNFGASTIIYNTSTTDTIHAIKLHSDVLGNLTLLINYDSKKSIILTKKSGSEWSEAQELSPEYTKGILYNVAKINTNTAQGYFTTFKMSYLEDIDTISEQTVNGPFDLYFYNHGEFNSAGTTTEDSTDTTSSSSTVKEIVVSHMGGVDFSEGSSTSEWEKQDGYATTWAQNGTYVTGEEYGSGLWYSNNASDNDYVYIQELGSVSLDSVTSINESNWLSTSDAIPSLKVGYVYVVKTRDGYAKFKVKALDTNSNDWNFTADYVYNQITTF